MPMSRIIRHSLSEEVQGQVNGKTRKMTKLEAIIEVQSAKALKGDTRAAKLLIDLGHKHITQRPEPLVYRWKRPCLCGWRRSSLNSFGVPLDDFLPKDGP